MEDNTLTDGWSWMDEDLKLDADFPLAMPHCEWDDLINNEAVVRSLFPCSSPNHVEDTDSPALSFQQQELQDFDPASLKRRRIMEFNDDTLMDISSYLPEQQETSDDFFVEVCKNLQTVDPSSSSSAWFHANEESVSSVDDAVEQSSWSGRVGCIGDSDDTSDVQELVHYGTQCPVNIVKPKTVPNKVQGLSTKARRPASSTFSDVGHQSFLCSQSNKQISSPGHVCIKKTPHNSGRFGPQQVGARPPVLSQPSKGSPCPSPAEMPTHKESANPVLAYPFALVKPMGIQGDITLQDINQRINTSFCRVKACLEQQPRTLSSSYSGKSVLALTKIHTEGNGVITIMRTKG